MKVGDSAQRYLNELEHAVLSFEYETVDSYAKPRSISFSLSSFREYTRNLDCRNIQL
jgi:sorbitol-specific phosphotransferase system component IIA